ncbi:MAG: homocysteine S-methyltransferase family protein [Rhizobiaceae bacterium]
MFVRVENLLATTKPYLTDGGLETTLIFNEGVDLPYFAAFTELKHDAGRARLCNYFRPYLEAARGQNTGFVLDTPTWRANVAWGKTMGLDHAEIAKINADAVGFAHTIRNKWESDELPIVINGAVGPAGDGYQIDREMSPEAAQVVHGVQINAFAKAGADMVSAVTMTHTGEALGVVRAAQTAGLPVVISFTVETDGRLPSGQEIGQAIEEVDRETGNATEYFMINCAHPDHFETALECGETWMTRICGIRANASRMSHAELDEAEELDDGNPGELASDYQRLQDLLPHLKVLGGCCGTDHRHISAVGHACIHLHAA